MKKSPVKGDRRGVRPPVKWSRSMTDVNHVTGGLTPLRSPVVRKTITMVIMTNLDRCRGALFGLAIGDALGAAIEFESPGTFAPVTGFRSGGPYGLAPGQWTDDTSMALALADSIAHKGWDLCDQAQRYCDWWKRGAYSVIGLCFDIGMTTRSALDQFLKTGDATTSGPTHEHSSGNGCIMRIAPVAIRYHSLFPHDLEQLAKLGAQSSLPTHASDMCLSASSYMTVLLAALIAGEERDKVLANDWYQLKLNPKVEAIARGSYRTRKPPEIRGSGFVIDCLEAALWVFHDAASFEEAVLKAVNLGDDADTTGAVSGQLAGAYFGESGIPAKLRHGVARSDMIEQALAGLLRKQDQR